MLRLSRVLRAASSATAAQAAPAAASAGASYQSARVSKLANGVRVASLGAVTGSAFVGVFVAGGARAESHELSGVTHFLARRGFGRTELAQSAKVERALEDAGVRATVLPDRDFLVYAGSLCLDKVPEFIEQAAAQVAGPVFHANELGDARDLVRSDVLISLTSIDAQVIDAVHAAAYGNATLGRSVTCPEWNAEAIGPDHLAAYTDARFAADQIVLVGNGVSHDALLAASAPLERIEPRARVESVREPAVYVGGEVRRPGPGAELSVALAFEGPALSQPAHVAASLVLQSILGFGVADDAMLPGSGCASRLNTNVVARAPGTVAQASAFAFAYADSGLFGVTASGNGASAAEIVHALTGELKGMGENISDDEFKRGVAQAKARVLERREHRGAHAAAVARSVLGTGETGDDMLTQLDQLTAADLSSVAKAIVKSPLTLVAIGAGTDSLPTYQSLASAF